MVGPLETKDSTKITEYLAMIGESKSSWCETYKNLLEDYVRVKGVKSNNKNWKREIK